VVNYGNFTLFETIYLVFGDKFVGTVVKQSNLNGKIIYNFSYYDEEVSKTCSSFPTTARLSLNETKKIRVVPFFNIALLHNFNFMVYLVSLVFFLFGLIVSIICLLFLFNMKNKIMIRILKNRNNQINT
jgi:hypothetical protein